MDDFKKMYGDLKNIKERFETLKVLFEEGENRVEEMRKHHDKSMSKLLEEIKKRDEIISEYLERIEHKEIEKLLVEIGYLIDEMYTARIKLFEEEQSEYQKDK